MRSQGKFHARYSNHSLAYSQNQDPQDPRGNLFISPVGQWDSNTLDVLHVGVDTVKQLYTGFIRQDVLLAVKCLYDSGHNQVIDIAGKSWLIRSGGQGGYTYILQNSDYGVIVHLRSRYVEGDLFGSHLKVELSPHFIHERETVQIQTDMDKLAEGFMFQWEYSGCATHLALDVQGFDVPADFDSVLTTKARARRFNGSDNVEFIGLGAVSQTYNRAETFMFGTASTLQFCLYRKDLEAVASDKLHFWRSVWEGATSERAFPDGVYSPSKPVWRLEFRFHHTVVGEFAEGTGFDGTNFLSVSEHLTGLWQYALNNFRLDQTSTYIRPEWQFFMQDIVFKHKSPHLLYKRAKKKPGELNGRALAIAFGGLTSVYARNGFDIAYCYKALQQSGIYEDLLAHYGMKELGPGYTASEAGAVVYDLLRRKLQEKILRGAAA